MLIEIYNEQGVRVLDNETKVMKTVQRLNMAQGQTFWYSNRNTPNSWYSEYNLEGYYANSNSKTEFAVSIGHTFSTVDITGALKMVRPKNGTTIATSNSAWGVAMVSSSNQTMRGEGVEFAYIKPTVANDASGFIDCYSPSGELMWSLASLITAPQLLKILDYPTTTSFDLNTIPANKRDKTFFYPVYEGEFDVIDDATTVFKAIVFTRVNNLVYFKEFGNNTIACKIFVAYIP